MSRIGKLPITLPKGVEVTMDGNKVSVKGPNGVLEETFSPEITIKLENGTITVERPNDEPRIRALHGTTRALINNMIVGCAKGFEVVLEFSGVGYRAELKGQDLLLNLGFSHPVNFPAPDGITYDVEAKTRLIKIKGRDRQQVGQVAAEIREFRGPEPYKGKGVKYAGEFIFRKEGKKK